MLPSASVATDEGVLNVAEVPWPSSDPMAPLPASVLTSAAGVILRMRLPPNSAA
ncbi:hypothetical protein D9M68_746080 [compost metagenome]